MVRPPKAHVSLRYSRSHALPPRRPRRWRRFVCLIPGVMPCPQSARVAGLQAFLICLLCVRSSKYNALPPRRPRRWWRQQAFLMCLLCVRSSKNNALPPRRSRRWRRQQAFLICLLGVRSSRLVLLPQSESTLEDNDKEKSETEPGKFE